MALRPESFVIGEGDPSRSVRLPVSCGAMYGNQMSSTLSL